MNNDKVSAPELEELKDCVAVKWVLFKAMEHCVAVKHLWLTVLVIIVSATIPTSLISAAIAWTVTRHEYAGWLDCLIVVIVWPVVIWVDITQSFDGKQWKLLKSYWHRNIVGYTMMFYHAVNSTDIEHGVFYGRRPPTTDYIKLHCCYLCLPLGGWFRRPFYHRFNTFDDWRPIRLAVPYHQLLLFIDDYSIVLSNRMGNRLVTSPKGAMRMISQFNSLGQALAKTATELEVAHQTLDQRNREVADWERHHTNLTASYSEQGKNFDDLVYTVTKAITEILKTSRFRDSNEGARIRKLLSGGVKQVLDVGDPRIAGLRAIEESREKKPVKGGVLRQDQAHPRKPGS